MIFSFPCPVTNTVNSRKIGIFSRSLFLTNGKKALVTAPFLVSVHCRCHILTLSDPTSDLVRHYGFPILLRCRVTSDTFFLRLFARSAVGACPTLFFAFVRPFRCRSLSDTFPRVVQTLANK